MAHTILIMGVIFAFAGKFIGVAYIALTEHKSTVPWVMFSLTGYAMMAGSQLGAFS
jgi:hypothetical protein